MYRCPQTTGNPADDNIAAGGGPCPSNCSVNTTSTTTVGTCTSGYPKPSWQNPARLPECPTIKRAIFPTSLCLSAAGFYGASFGRSVTVPRPGLRQHRNYYGHRQLRGRFDRRLLRQSASVALRQPRQPLPESWPWSSRRPANVKARPPQSILYGLFKSTPSVFHDVTTGNNSVGCSPTSTTTTATCITNSQGLTSKAATTPPPVMTSQPAWAAWTRSSLVNAWTSASGSPFSRECGCHALMPPALPPRILSPLPST